MLPNMSRTLRRWARSVTVKTISKTTVDFVSVDTASSRTQKCVVQVADKERLNSTTIDWSLEYLTIHSKDAIAIGELVEFNGADYKVISRGAWSDYGYTEVLAEETKRPLL